MKKSELRKIIREEIIADQDMMKSFDATVKALTNKKIPCRVKLVDNEIVIECGTDYPDSFKDKITDITDPMGIDVNICAAQSGGHTTRVQSIAGGPKRFW